MDAPSTTTTTDPTFVLTAHLAAEIVEQLGDAGIATYSVSVTGGAHWPSISIFPDADGQSAVDRVAEMFDLEPDNGGGDYYTRTGTVRGVKVAAWTSRHDEADDDAPESLTATLAFCASAKAAKA